MTWTVELTKFDNDSIKNEILKDGLSIAADDESCWKKETREMKAIRKLYQNSVQTIDKDAAYLFVVNHPEEDKFKGTEGDMPRSQSVGYIFKDNVTDASKFGRLVAHEIGHGVYKFQHTFDYGVAEKSTDNLMDYNNGDFLAHYQWRVMQDSVMFVWGLFQDDEDGMKKIKFKKVDSIDNLLINVSSFDSDFAPNIGQGKLNVKFCLSEKNDEKKMPVNLTKPSKYFITIFDKNGDLIYYETQAYKANTSKKTKEEQLIQSNFDWYGKVIRWNSLSQPVGENLTINDSKKLQDAAIDDGPFTIIITLLPQDQSIDMDKSKTKNEFKNWILSQCDVLEDTGDTNKSDSEEDSEKIEEPSLSCPYLTYEKSFDFSDMAKECITFSKYYSLINKKEPNKYIYYKKIYSTFMQYKDVKEAGGPLQYFEKNLEETEFLGHTFLAHKDLIGYLDLLKLFLKGYGQENIENMTESELDQIDNYYKQLTRKYKSISGSVNCVQIRVANSTKNKSKALSNHAIGYAIDIWPARNPQIDPANDIYEACLSEYIRILTGFDISVGENNDPKKSKKSYDVIRAHKIFVDNFKINGTNIDRHKFMEIMHKIVAYENDDTKIKPYKIDDINNLISNINDEIKSGISQEKKSDFKSKLDSLKQILASYNMCLVIDKHSNYEVDNLVKKIDEMIKSNFTNPFNSLNKN